MQRGRIIESEIIKSDGEGYRERGEVYKQRERERATREGGQMQKIQGRRMVR